jgi:hypothetical protein
LFDGIDGVNGFPPIVEALRLDLSLTRIEFSYIVRFHVNTVARWEKQLTAIPLLNKEYWDGNPRSKFLDRFQMFVLAYMAMLRADVPFNSVIPVLRKHAINLTRENLNQFCKEKFDV